MIAGWWLCEYVYPSDTSERYAEPLESRHFFGWSEKEVKGWTKDPNDVLDWVRNGRLPRFPTVIANEKA